MGYIEQQQQMQPRQQSREHLQSRSRQQSRDRAVDAVGAPLDPSGGTLNASMASHGPSAAARHLRAAAQGGVGTGSRPVGARQGGSYRTPQNLARGADSDDTSSHHAQNHRGVERRPLADAARAQYAQPARAGQEQPQNRKNNGGLRLPRLFG